MRLCAPRCDGALTETPQDRAAAAVAFGDARRAPGRGALGRAGARRSNSYGVGMDENGNPVRLTPSEALGIGPFP
jgi:hypothetical protein